MFAALLAIASAATSRAADEPFSAPATALATDRAWVRFRFDPALLASHGFEIEPAGAVLELEAAPPASFVVDAAGADCEGITSGSLQFAGGFVLRHRGTAVSLVVFELRPGADPLSVDLVDARGRRLFHGDQMHFAYDPASRRLRLEHVDVRIAPELAAEIGEPRFEGLAIARLELEASTRAVRAPAPEGCSSCSDPVWIGDVDVELADLYGVQQIARDSGAVTVNLSTKLRSGGTADVPWYRKFTGSFDPYGNDQHPYLVWALYRIAPVPGADGATRLELLGQSALKHAFFTTNQDCCCSGGQILWAPIGGPTHDTVACTDVYGTGNNNDPNALGPRDELEAHSGIWDSTGSFFDQDADGVCDWDTPQSPGGDCGNLTFADTFDRRLAVAESDLATADATWYADAWYLVRDDVDLFNTMGWRRIAPAFGGSSWTFPATTALALGSVLDAWVPYGAAPAGASHERIDTGVGELSLASRATDLGDGQWHYEYALANHDFDRKVQTFRVPLPPGAVVANAVFRGVPTSAAADWTVTVGAEAIVFQAPADPNSNALDWGTLFSFGFDVNAAPAAGSADLGALEQTPTLRFAAPAVTPGGTLGSAVFFDDTESGGTARWSATGS